MEKYTVNADGSLSEYTEKPITSQNYNPVQSTKRKKLKTSFPEQSDKRKKLKTSFPEQWDKRKKSPKNYQRKHPPGFRIKWSRVLS